MMVFKCRVGVKKTCSDKCYQQLKSIQSSKRKDKTHQLICENCGKDFDMFESRVRGGRRFCSMNCYLASTTPTNPERRIAEYLQQNNIPFTPQVKIGRYHVDFLLPNNIIIEAYGDYWHAHPDKYDRRKLTPKQKKVYNRDKKRIAYFRENGYKPFVLWERDINNNVTLAIGEAISEYKQLYLF